jgi:hypothetical protein
LDGLIVPTRRHVPIPDHNSAADQSAAGSCPMSVTSSSPVEHRGPWRQGAAQ